MNKKGIIWDFGGVVTSSPFENFKEFETNNGLPAGFIRTVNSHNPLKNAWALLEKGSIDHLVFDDLFYRESKRLGYGIRGSEVLPLINCAIRNDIVDIILKLKTIGVIQLCLTNNIKNPLPSNMNDDEYRLKIKIILNYFDHVIESSKLGLRKPDLQIYRLAINKLNLAPNQIVYFDDLGINLKPASNLGMKTIKVLNKQQLIEELKRNFPEVF